MKILFAVTSHGKLGETGRPTGYWLSGVTHTWSVLSPIDEIDGLRPKGGKLLIEGKRLDYSANSEEVLHGTAKAVPLLLQTSLIDKGAIFDSTPPWSGHFVVEQRLATGQNHQSALSVGKKLPELLPTP